MPDGPAPVMAGAGIATGGDVEAAALMVEAVAAAGRDAGSATLLAAADRIVVPKGTWSYTDPGRIVAEAVGATRASTWLVDIGIPQQTLINDALTAIMDGSCRVVIVVGGEARARDLRARRAGTTAAETDQHGAQPDVLMARPDAEMIAPAEIAAGIVVPVEQYALMENALRAAAGQSLEEHRRSVDALWAAFNEVAGGNPHAAFRAPMDARAIGSPSATNRPLAFPYNKWHASQWNVDQAAAVILCSQSAARDFGVVDDRWLHPLVGLESSGAISLSKRRELSTWPAMRVLGDTATARLGRPLADIEHIELYSCFPSAVRIQQRELALESRHVPTFTGGMAFAGGPFNNFVLQATAELAHRLRQQPAATGLVTTVSGMLTKPGLAVWSGRSDGNPPLVGDLADQAEAATPTVEVALDHTGEATVSSYTVTYDGQTPARVVVMADTPDGSRCVVVTQDAELAAHSIAHELIGAPIRVSGGSFSL